MAKISGCTTLSIRRRTKPCMCVCFKRRQNRWRDGSWLNYIVAINSIT